MTLNTGTLRRNSSGDTVFLLVDGMGRDVLSVWRSSLYSGEPFTYRLHFHGKPTLAALPGHPLYGILHDIREGDADLWPILVDMLLDYPETAEIMRQIVEAAQ